MEGFIQNRNVLTMLLTLLLGNMVASVTMTMENFMGGICKSNPSDISFWGISYAQCLNECRARTGCTAINVHAKSQLCQLNMDNTGVAEADCEGFVRSWKDEWSQPELPECMGVTCSSSQACEVDPATGSPDCAFKECPEIDNILGGTILGNLRMIGAKKHYVCDQSRSLIGDDVRTCNDMGDWTGTAPICQPDPIHVVTEVQVVTEEIVVEALGATAATPALQATDDSVEQS